MYRYRATSPINSVSTFLAPAWCALRVVLVCRFASLALLPPFLSAALFVLTFILWPFTASAFVSNYTLETLFIIAELSNVSVSCIASVFSFAVRIIISSKQLDSVRVHLCSNCVGTRVAHVSPQKLTATIKAPFSRPHPTPTSLWTSWLHKSSKKKPLLLT